MKRLKSFVSKHVLVTFNDGRTMTGYVWTYASDRSVYWSRPEVEYYVGYDGGVMTLVRPTDVKDVKVVDDDK